MALKIEGIKPNNSMKTSTRLQGYVNKILINTNSQIMRIDKKEFKDPQSIPKLHHRDQDNIKFLLCPQAQEEVQIYIRTH